MQVVAWDEPGVGVPMEAGLTPQEAIARGLPNPADENAGRGYSKEGDRLC